MSPTPKKPLTLKHLPEFYVQRKRLEQSSKPNLQSKVVKEFVEGKTPLPEFSVPQPKFRSKPFTIKQKAAHKRMAIACAKLERQNAQDSMIARQQMRMRNTQTTFINKLGKCKDCGHLVHRGTNHTNDVCMENIMRRKLIIPP